MGPQTLEVSPTWSYLAGLAVCGPKVNLLCTTRLQVPRRGHVHYVTMYSPSSSVVNEPKRCATHAAHIISGWGSIDLPPT
jgi:hypothetical protein